MFDLGATTRMSVIVFAALTLVVFGLLAVARASARGDHFLPHILGFAVYFLASRVYLPYRVYKDATLKRRNTALWAVIASLLSLAGAVLYFVIAVVGYDAID